MWLSANQRGVRVASWFQLGRWCVEQTSDSEVVESGEAERGPLHSLDQVVGRLRGSVGQVGLMPGRDLITPAHDGATEPVDLRRTSAILQIVAEAGNELKGEVQVVMVVDAAARRHVRPGQW